MELERPLVKMARTLAIGVALLALAAPGAAGADSGTPPASGAPPVSGKTQTPAECSGDPGFTVPAPPWPGDRGFVVQAPPWPGDRGFTPGGAQPNSEPAPSSEPAPLPRCGQEVSSGTGGEATPTPPKGTPAPEP